MENVNVKLLLLALYASQDTMRVLSNHNVVKSSLLQRHGVLHHKIDDFQKIIPRE